MDGLRLTSAQRLKMAAIIAETAELGRHGYDNSCPFGCSADPPFHDRLTHASDCPITYARELQAFGREITG